MSPELEFEHTIIFPGLIGPEALTTCMVQVNECEVWVGWNNGGLTAHSTLGLDYMQDQNYYFDNAAEYLTARTITENLSVNQRLISVLGITVWAGIVYVFRSINFNGTTFYYLDVYDPSSGEKINSIPVPTSYSAIASNLAASKNKIWFTTFSTNSTGNNLLVCFDIANQTWSTRAIPGRRQTEVRHIIDGLDTYLWVTSKNNHSIVLFDNDTGLYVSTHVVNRHPYHLSVDQNTVLTVMSDQNNSNSLVSVVNQSTKEVTDYCSGLGATSVINDLRTDYVWLVGGTINRVSKTNLDGGQVKFNRDDFFEPVETITLTEAVLTNEYTYDKYDPNTGAVAPLTVRPYLFVLAGEVVLAFRATSLKAVNSSEILGTAMIAIGAQGYYGG